MAQNRSLFSPLSMCLVGLTALFLLAPSPAWGQIDSWGVKAGVTTMTSRGDILLEKNLGRTTGFLVGGTAQIGVAGPFSVRPELMIVRKGWSLDFRDAQNNEATSTITLDYLELPVLATVELPGTQLVTPVVFLGPTFGLKVNSDLDTSVDLERANYLPGESISSTEVGLAVGGGARVEAGGPEVSIDVRYQRSLSNINAQAVVGPDGQTREPPTIHNQGFFVAVGVAF